MSQSQLLTPAVRLAGCVNFALTMRRAEYFIPAGVLLKCFLETTDRELFDRLVASAPRGEGENSGGHATFVAERAELLLRQAARAGVRSRSECLAYLGRHFRVALEVEAGESDEAAGSRLLREFIFIHLEDDAEKMALLIAMLQKLYALVNGECCEVRAKKSTCVRFWLRPCRCGTTTSNF